MKEHDMSSSITPAAAEWPTHVEELSRKLNDQLAKKMKAHAEGKIDDRTFYLLVNTMWDLTSGLVFEADSRTLEAVHAALRASMKVKK
jgi:hypothetical protein